MIKTKYSTPSLSNLVSVKLCCYLPLDKKVPFGFIRQQDKDLFNHPNLTMNLTTNLTTNLTLYIKTFEFDEKFIVFYYLYILSRSISTIDHTKHPRLAGCFVV